jgi:glycerol-3-phosphate dehydrogenase (NAD(P)+)
MIGLAGTGDLVATALAPESRNRRAGELLAQGVPAREIPARVGQAVEALESVPLMATALINAGIEAPVTTALAQLISGDLPLDDWVGVVRTTVPPPARWRPPVGPGFWRRLRERLRTLFTRRREKRHRMFTSAEGGDATVRDEPQRKERADAADHRDSGQGD